MMDDGIIGTGDTGGAAVTDAVAQQDVGRVRTGQEDACRADRFDAPRAALLVVADGMGGHAAGEVASAAALGALVAALRPALEGLRPLPTLPLPPEEDAGAGGAAGGAAGGEKGDAEALPAPEAAPPRLAELVTAAFAAAQEAVRAAALEAGARDAGTTLTAAVVAGRSLVVAHVGDSRAYLWRQSALQLLTQDHSGATALLAAGLIAPDEARTHPAAHQLYRDLGGPPNAARPEVAELRLEAGDLLLLCSDGLWNMLPDAQIAALLLGAGDPAQADLAALAAALIDAANEAGGEDNISVVLARTGAIG